MSQPSVLCRAAKTNFRGSVRGEWSIPNGCSRKEGRHWPCQGFAGGPNLAQLVFLSPIIGWWSWASWVLPRLERAQLCGGNSTDFQASSQNNFINGSKSILKRKRVAEELQWEKSAIRPSGVYMFSKFPKLEKERRGNTVTVGDGQQHHEGG